MSRQRKQPPVTVPPREFIEAWQGSNSVAEVARKVRSRKPAVRVRAWRFRQRGVPLKEFPPVEIEPTDWAELARYAAELGGEDVDEDEEEGADEDGDEAG